MKNIGVCHITATSIGARHSRGSLGSAPVSYVLELTGFLQCISNVLYYTCKKSANLQCAIRLIFWIRKYTGFILELARCQVITVGYIH